MFQHFCYSCGMPMEMPGAMGRAKHYCTYCTDVSGRLKPWEAIVEDTADYLAIWQPNITPEIARERAIRYLTAMPAWADKAQ